MISNKNIDAVNKEDPYKILLKKLMQKKKTKQKENIFDHLYLTTYNEWRELGDWGWKYKDVICYRDKNRQIFGF